jgi:hypothetical protein
MINEEDKIVFKWYQMPRWQWTGPGGYYGGFFAGLGVGIMLMTGARFDLIQAYREHKFGAGAAIMVITNLVCWHLEGRDDKNHGEKNG